MTDSVDECCVDETTEEETCVGGLSQGDQMGFFTAQKRKLGFFKISMAVKKSSQKAWQKLAELGFLGN